MRLLRIDRDLNTTRQREFNWVGVAERKHNRFLSLHLNAVSDTHHVEFLFPAIRHTLNGVEHQRARQPMHRCMRVIRTLNRKHAVLLREGNACGNQYVHLALGTFHYDDVALHGVLHTLGQRDGLLADT